MGFVPPVRIGGHRGDRDGGVLAGSGTAVLEGLARSAQAWTLCVAPRFARAVATETPPLGKPLLLRGTYPGELSRGETGTATASGFDLDGTHTVAVGGDESRTADEGPPKKFAPRMSAIEDTLARSGALDVNYPCRVGGGGREPRERAIDPCGLFFFIDPSRGGALRMDGGSFS